MKQHHEGFFKLRPLLDYRDPAAKHAWERKQKPVEVDLTDLLDDQSRGAWQDGAGDVQARRVSRPASFKATA